MAANVIGPAGRGWATSAMKTKRALRVPLQSFGYRTPGTMQHAGLVSVLLTVILAARIVPGTQAAPITTAPTAEIFTLEDPSAPPLEFPDEYSITIEQAMVCTVAFLLEITTKLLILLLNRLIEKILRR